ncbi:G-protein coupled receptor 1 [Zea mays]|uniref:G-protein coupled receptor 1 n=1 Tax=Zea mays TaxID=4577 RepID=A0A1D6LUJ1_MAIZE|nr:G-protein coupled receptor 1 [Zea mays]
MAPAVAAAASAAMRQALRDRQILDAVGTGAAALSLAGSSFIVICYLLFRELRKFSFKLVFYLAVSDMFCSLFTILGGPSNAFYCFAHDYSAHFFCVASFLWTTTISFTLHRTVVKHKTDVEEFGSIFHLYVWGTSLSTTVLRSIGSDYGRPGTWCWIQQGSMAKACDLLCCFSFFLDYYTNISSMCHFFESYVLHLITFYLPLWGAILYNGFTYYEVNRMLNNATQMAAGISDQSNQSDIRAGRKAFNRWGYYPLILIGSWAFATINRLYDFANPGHRIVWLSFLDVGFAGLMGLFNSIAYGLNSSVRRAIAERIDTFLPERIKRSLPALSRLRSQQENELTSLIVEGN